MSLNGECLYRTLTGYTVLKCVRVLFLQEPEFRPTYGRLHELRALVPRGSHSWQQQQLQHLL